MSTTGVENSGVPVNFRDPKGLYAEPVLLGSLTLDPTNGGLEPGPGGNRDVNGGGAGPEYSLPVTGTSEGPGGALQGGIMPGSPVFSIAFDALTNDKEMFYGLFMGQQSENCESDLKKLGVTDNQIAMAALNANIINGLGVTGATTTYAQAGWGASPLYGSAVAQFGSTTVTQYMTLVNPAAAALAQLGGSNIYINASWVNGMSTSDRQAMLLHELTHNITGKDDESLQRALGLPTGAASQNIGDRLRGDCFK